MYDIGAYTCAIVEKTVNSQVRLDALSDVYSGIYALTPTWDALAQALRSLHKTVKSFGPVSQSQ